MSRLRLAWRLTRPQVVGDWWRWLLGGLLIGAALSLAALLLANADDTPDAIVVAPTALQPGPRVVPIAYRGSAIRVRGGGADATVDMNGNGGFTSAATTPAASTPKPQSVPLTITAPEGTRAASGRAATFRLRTASRAWNLPLTDLDDRSATPALAIDAGRAPRSENEIALPDQAFEQLGVTVGAELVVMAPTFRQGDVVRVVGRVRDGGFVGVGFDEGPPSWGRIGAAGLDGVPLHARVVVVHRTDGGASNFLAGGSTSSGGSGDSQDGIGASFTVRTGGTSSALGWVLALFFSFIPLLLPMLAVSAIYAVGLERRAADRRRLESVGVPPWMVRSPDLAGGVLVGAVAAASALAIARISGDSVLRGPIVVVVTTIGVLLGLGVTTTASRRVRSLGAAPRVRTSPRPWLLGVSAAVCTASGLAIHLSGGISILGLVLVASSITLLFVLAGAIVALAARVAPTPASRVALASTAHVRWLSTPAAALIGLAAVVTFWVSAVSHAPKTVDSPTPHHIVIPGSLIDAEDSRITPRQAVVTALASAGVTAQIAQLHRVSGAGCPLISWQALQANLRGGIRPTLAMPRSQIGVLGVAGQRIPSAAKVVLLDAPTTDLASVCSDGRSWTLPVGTRTFDLATSREGRLPQAVVPLDSVDALGLTIHHPAGWFIRPDHQLDGDELAALSGSLRREGLTLLGAGVSEGPFAASAVLDIVAGLGFAVLCAIALLLAAAERRSERRVLRAVGVSPRDERLGEAVATGGLALAGIASAVIVLTLAVLTVSGGDYREALPVVSRSWVAIVLIIATPPVAALVAYIVVSPSDRRARSLTV